MKRALLTTSAIVIGALWFGVPTPTYAAVLSLGPSPASEGLTYTLTENSITNGGLTANFTFQISGENTAADLEGGINAGRSGINAFAFNQPAPGTVVSGIVSAPPNFAFVLGGLNSTGCDGSGNFFCFDNTTIPPTPAGSLSGPITIQFSVTANQAGVWNGYTTDLKIDWVGTANNYNLISQPIPVNTGGTPPPPPPPPPVPEPASLLILGTGLLGLAVASQRKRRA